MKHSQESSAQNASRSVRPGRRLLCLLLAATILAAGTIYGMIWWEERPLAKAAELNEQGDSQQALQIIDEFLRKHPQHGRALSLRARVLVSLGQPAQAVDLFERVGAPEPEDLHAWAQALLQMERWSEALPVLQFVQTTGVHKADVLHELAACCAKLGDYEGAIEAATEFSRLTGFEARGKLLLGTIHWERGDMQQVAAAWADVLKHQPAADDLQIPPESFFLEYGRALLEVGDPSAAAEQLRRCLEIQETSTVLVTLADALIQVESADEAEELYIRALELDPSNIRARLGAAQLCLTQGTPEQALEWLAPFESRQDISSEAAFLLQQTYTRLDDLDAAELWRQKADERRRSETLQAATDQVLRDSPNSAWADVIRAYRFAESGNWGEAQHILDRMRSVADEEPFIKSLIEAVDRRGELPPLQELPLTQF